MSDIKALKEITRDLKVLYAEDEDDARFVLDMMLKKFFGTVVAVPNGKEGLDKFKTEHFDMIITDIRMPIMDGIEMIGEVKKINPKIPIVITSAYSEEQYFLKAIELGVSNYLLKPFKTDNIISTISNIANALKNEKEAEKYRHEQLQKELNKVASITLEEIANAYPNPTIVLENGNITFINLAFNRVLGAERMAKILDKSISLDSVFEQTNGYAKSLDDIKKGVSNRVSIISNKQNRVFMVNFENIELPNKKFTIYTFTDITLVEYQKIKIGNYKAQLEEFLWLKHKSQMKNQIRQTKEVELTVVKEKVAPTVSREKTLLSDEERDILRKSRVDKTPATDYIKELDGSVFDELEELKELENDLKYNIDEFEVNPTLNELKILSRMYAKYAKTIELLFEFQDLAFSISSFANSIGDIETLDERLIKKILIYMKNILQDLISWRNGIFVNQITKDIHYLDSSLFSNCLQFEMMLSEKDYDSNDDMGLELF